VAAIQRYMVGTTGEIRVLALWHRKERQMALNPPFTIRIEKPETALAETMNEMRTWLDSHGVQPVEFKIAMTGIPGISFDVRFRTEDEAVLFEQVFA
jgi:hypothetical protein